MPRYDVPCSRCQKVIQRSSNKIGKPPLCMGCMKDVRRERLEMTKLRRAIDWQAVDYVVRGGTLHGLTSAEVRMIARQVSDRMLDVGDSSKHIPPGKLTATMMGERVGMSETGMQAVFRRLPEAERRRCPECRGDMWVLANGVIEEHGDRYLQDSCTMSDRLADGTVALQPMPRRLLPRRLLLRGLARMRPDLYRWLVAS